MESIFVKFAQYPSIETERLLLRPVTLDDAEEMFEYASDREIRATLFQPIKAWKKPKIILRSSTWSIPWDVGE